MVRMIWTTLAASAVLASAAQAQLVSATTPATIVRALQGAGYKADLGKDSTGDPVISSSSSGTGFAIYFYGCAKSVACKTVQFSASYENVTPPATLARINEWNRDKRWGQAYLTDADTLRVQMDVDLEQGGMSNALFVDNLEYWVTTMAAFEKFIAGK
ncbi:hypothetical protein BH09PSE3_BH09PSE3_09300 [soil metagenome]